MAIGYDPGGDGGYGSGDGWIDSIRHAWNQTVATIHTRVDQIAEAVYGWVSTIVDVAMWVLEWIAEVYPVEWDQWTTAGDERTCPECGPLDGLAWERDGGPPVGAPPLHVNCRCQVVHAWTEWRTRWVQEWRLRWFSQERWEWQRTGWEWRTEVTTWWA